VETGVNLDPLARVPWEEQGAKDIIYPQNDFIIFTSHNAEQENS
jgi:hypothetical protein